MNSARPWRLGAVGGTVGGAALSLIASTQTWFHVVLRDSPDTAMAVDGSSALPVLAPLSLAALALGAVVTISGRVFAYVLAALTIATGALIVALTLPIVVEMPVWAVAAAVTEATGIAGDAAVSALVVGLTATGWAVAALAGGVLVTAAGVWIACTAHRWRTTGRRYRAPSAQEAAKQAAQPAADRPGDHVDAFDAWDGLSRGDDPTR